MLKRASKINRLQSVVAAVSVLLGASFVGFGLYSAVTQIEDPRVMTRLPGFQGQEDMAVAVVNGHEILLSDVIMARAELPRLADGLPEPQVVEAVIARLIDRRLFAEAGWKAGLTRDAVMQGRFRFEREKLLRDQYIAALVEAKITEQDILRLYTERYVDEEWGREARLLQILVRSRPEIDEVMARMKDGERFDDLARQFSLDEFAVAGGDMGYQSASTLIGPVAERAFHLDEGERSLPFRSRFGWHVIWLQDVRRKKPPALIAVRNQLKHELIDQALTRNLADLRADARIDRMDFPGKANLDRALVASQ